MSSLSARKPGTTTIVASGAPQTASPRCSRGSLAASKRTAAHQRLLLRPTGPSTSQPTDESHHYRVCRAIARISPYSSPRVKQFPFHNSHCFYTPALATASGSDLNGYIYLSVRHRLTSNFTSWPARKFCLWQVHAAFKVARPGGEVLYLP